MGPLYNLGHIASAWSYFSPDGVLHPVRLQGCGEPRMDMACRGRTLQWDLGAASTWDRCCACNLASRRVERQIDCVRQAGDNSLLLRRKIFHLERNLLPSALSPGGCRAPEGQGGVCRWAAAL